MVMDVLDWLVQSSEQVTVVMILMIIVFVLVYGMQRERRWLVPGWMLSDCEAENKELKAQVAEYVQRTEDRVEKLEFIVEQRSSAHREGS